jgi:hypothetical protein
MTNSVKSGEKILAYDADCPMCGSTIAWLLRAGLLKPQQTRGNHDLAGDEREAALAAGIRNQLVVLDPETGETRAGTDGLLWIIGDNTGHPLLVRLLSLSGLRQALRWGYETISYNRRVISPPRHQVVCDCEPEVTAARRWMLIGPTLAAALLVVALFGAAVFLGWELGDGWSGALFMEVAAGSGWTALVLAALVGLRGGQRGDYLAHLAVTLFAGALVLVPSSLLVPLVPRPGLVVLDGVSVLASFWLMFRMQRRRVAAAGLAQRWLWAWVVAVGAGFVVTTCGYFGVPW